MVTDVLPSKRERALRLGADAVVDSGDADAVAQVRAAPNESADVVFDCVAVQATVDQAIAMALKGGTVVVVGVASHDLTVPIPLIQDQQVRLQGSATYLGEDMQDAMRILATSDMRTEDYVTTVLKLDQAAEAFALAAGGEQVKVVLTT